MDTPISTNWLHETDGVRLLLRKQARLFVAARLLATSPGLFADVVRKVGVATVVRPTDSARQHCRAAVLLADELIRLNDDIPNLPNSGEAVMVNGGPHTADAVKLAEIDDAA